MTLTAQDRVLTEYLDEHRNDGVNEDTCYYWFEKDIENNEWADAKWIELSERFLSYGSALTNFLGSESVGRGLQRLDIGELWVHSEGITALVNNPAMVELTTLDIGEMNDDITHALRDIVNSPYLKNLTDLTISKCRLSIEDARAIIDDGRAWESFCLRNSTSAGELSTMFSNDAFTTLKSLVLYDCVITEDDLNALSRSTCISKLHTLNLDRTEQPERKPIGFDAITALFSEHKKYKIKELSYRFQNWKDPVPAEVIESWPTLTTLRTLNLGWNHMGHEAINALIEHPTCSKLTTLELTKNQATSDTANAIAETENLSKLKELNLWQNQSIGDAGALALAGSTTLPKLRILNVVDCSLSFIGHRALLDSKTLKVTKKGLEAGELIEPPEAKRLKGKDKLYFMLESGMLDGSDVLDISTEEIDDHCIDILTNHANAAKVGTLRMNKCNLTDAQLVALVSKKSKLTKLKNLYMADNDISNDVMEEIAEMTKIRRLDILDLSNNRIGASGASKLCGSSDWKYLYFDGNKASSGSDDDIYELIDWYWTSSIGDYIDLIDERR